MLRTSDPAVVPLRRLEELEMPVRGERSAALAERLHVLGWHGREAARDSDVLAENRPLIVTSETGVVPPGQLGTEEDAPIPSWKTLSISTDYDGLGDAIAVAPIERQPRVLAQRSKFWLIGLRIGSVPRTGTRGGS